MVFKPLREALDSMKHPSDVKDLIDYYVSLGACTECGADAKARKFANKESEREYAISGLCQNCQDKVFGR